MSDSHTKYVWISSNGLGRKNMTDGRTYGQTDRSDIRICYLLFFCFCFHKERVDKLLNFFPDYILYLLLENFVHVMRHFITGNINVFPVHYGLTHVFGGNP